MQERSHSKLCSYIFGALTKMMTWGDNSNYIMFKCQNGSFKHSIWMTVMNKINFYLTSDLWCLKNGRNLWSSNIIRNTDHWIQLMHGTYTSHVSNRFVQISTLWWPKNGHAIFKLSATVNVENLYIVFDKATRRTTTQGLNRHGIYELVEQSIVKYFLL